METQEEFYARMNREAEQRAAEREKKKLEVINIIRISNRSTKMKNSYRFIV